MADYLAVLAITDSEDDDETGRQSASVSLRTILAEASVDPSDIRRLITPSGQALLIPPSALDRVAGVTAVPRHPVLRLGVAAGMCHYDGRGWFGDALTAARQMADECRSAPGTGSAIFLLTDDAYRQLLSRRTKALFQALPDVGWLRAVTATLTSPELLTEPTAVRTDLRFAAEVLEELARPISAVIDRLPSLLSPSSTPAEVLDWMYEALGVESATLLTEEQGRRLIPHVLDCYQRRGTASGLRALLELRYGIHAEIVDSGSTTWSVEPGTPAPFPPAHVTIHLDAGEALPGLDEVIRSALPIAIRYRVDRR